MGGKYIYIVRHAKTVSNEAGVIDSSGSPLSTEGRAQADALAQRFANISFSHLLSSPMPRALETAQAIERATGVRIVQSDDLVEVVPDAQYLGKLYTDPEVLPIWFIKPKSIDEHRGPWGASMEELLDRAQRVIKHVESLEGDTVIVTHGVFKPFLVSVALFDKPSLDTMWNFYRFTDRGNAGVTSLNHVWGHWYLNSWNDRAHLMQKPIHG